MVKLMEKLCLPCFLVYHIFLRQNETGSSFGPRRIRGVGGGGGGVRGFKHPLWIRGKTFFSCLLFLILFCLSERLVIYEDTPIPDAKLFIPLQFRTPVRTHLHTANQRPRVLICIQPIHRGWFNPRYKLVRPPLLPSTARGAVGI